MNSLKPYSFVGIAAAMHLLVDGICLCTLYIMASSFRMNNILAVFLTYNIIAFMSQPFTGILVDKYKKIHWILISAIAFLIFAVVGCIILTNSQSIQGKVIPLIIALLLGIGNSLFHVWGGKQIVLKTGNDMRSLGVFVSTGAFGLAVSLVFYSWSLLYLYLIILCLLAYLYISADDGNNVKSKIDNHEVSNDNKYSTSLVLASILAVAAFVMFRSFIGETFSSDIHKNNFLIIILGAVAMFGKMSGGWIARKIGIAKTLFFDILIVAICYLLKADGLLPVLAGIYVINTTMPITLYLANHVLKGKEGLAFGILAAALIPGFLFAML